MCVCVCVCVRVSFCLCIRLHVCVSACACVSVCICLVSVLCLCVWVCGCVYLSVCLSICGYVCLSLSLTGLYIYLCVCVLLQADLEREHGLPVTAMFETEKDTPAHGRFSINFIDYVVMPLWEGIVSFLPELKPVLKQMYRNRIEWQNMLEPGKLISFSSFVCFSTKRANQFSGSVLSLKVCSSDSLPQFDFTVL